MRIGRQRRSTSEGDMTSMIDMVFQLIAFFMVLINFSEVEQDQRVNLPLSELAKPPEVAYEKPITLQMTAGDEVIFAGELISLTQLEAALKREAQILRAANAQVEFADLTVIVRADQFARTGKVQEMIAAAQQAGFSTFALRGRQSDVPLQTSPQP